MILSSSESQEWRNSDHILPQDQQLFAANPWGEPAKGGQLNGFNQWVPPELSPQQAAGSKTDKEQGVTADNVDSDTSGSVENAEQASSQHQQAQLEMISSEQLETAKTQAFEDGRRIGYAEAEQEFSQAKDVFTKLCDEIHEAHKDVASFFMPLKQLSLSIAEAVVRGELESSSEVIERLVTDMMKNVEQQGEMPVLLSLNEEDLLLIDGHLKQEYPKLTVKQDPGLSRGSVRLAFENSVIEDLMESRLNQISTVLTSEVTAQNDPDPVDTDADVAVQGVSEELQGQYEQPVVAEEDANSILTPETHDDGLIIDVTDQDTSEDDQ